MNDHKAKYVHSLNNCKIEAEKILFRLVPDLNL